MKTTKANTPTALNKDLHFDSEFYKNEEWLTIDATMKHLNVSRSTIYRLRKLGMIPSFKLGGVLLFPKSFLNQLLLHGSKRNLKID
ncbi:HTH domain protein [Formosa agariphila KMM 3901]|uniref:HTH domain protein n=1 Tax=Formosa agariphila (strain DSM 15362 / KCTC 12365 / LMG 23005 / KMM 3901 / M-2Alg 35-1) TaxID=1347342 RepID=T2KMR2_FORAG|nr:helix-turn-helix domain-containing protein [Formosa agariphila]CDF80035.1 HTH domain protein [Formosa agariphila KMM 3901]